MPLLNLFSLLHGKFFGSDLLRGELDESQLVVENMLTMGVFVVDDHSELIKVILNLLFELVLEGIHFSALLEAHVLLRLNHLLRILLVVLEVLSGFLLLTLLIELLLEEELLPGLMLGE